MIAYDKETSNVQCQCKSTVVYGCSSSVPARVYGGNYSGKII